MAPADGELALTARYLRRQLEAIESNLPGALAGADPRCLHDYRVAVRRTRAVQRQLGQVLGAKPVARARRDFQWLQGVTGETRDLDVDIEGFERWRGLVPDAQRGDLDPLLAFLGGRRSAAREAMAEALGTERARAALSQWSELLDRLDQRADADRPNKARPIGAVASRRIEKLVRKMLRAGGRMRRRGTPKALHDLRKTGKELRYLLEVFGPSLYGEEAVSSMLNALKKLQDVLGRHQDRIVQVATIRSLGEEAAGLPDGHRVAAATEVLIERLSDEAALARAEFGPAFSDFARRLRDSLA
jgi:CHAD domain-containing protein